MYTQKMRLYDERFHNQKRNVKAWIAIHVTGSGSLVVRLLGLFSTSDWANFEASKHINAVTESVREVENTMDMMVP